MDFRQNVRKLYSKAKQLDIQIGYVYSSFGAMISFCGKTKDVSEYLTSHEDYVILREFLLWCEKHNIIACASNDFGIDPMINKIFKKYNMYLNSNFSCCWHYINNPETDFQMHTGKAHEEFWDDVLEYIDTELVLRYSEGAKWQM